MCRSNLTNGIFTEIRRTWIDQRIRLPTCVPPQGAGGWRDIRTLVHGYEYYEEIDTIKDVTTINDAFGLGDGGLISDANGIAKYLKALFHDKSILSQQSLDGMLTFHPEEDYGLGIVRSNTKHGLVWGHNGASFGFQGDMYYFPEKNITYVLLTNYFNTQILDAVFEKSISLILDLQSRN